MKFKVAKVNCQNCVNLIKNSLEDDFGKIDINLEDKILNVEISENDIEKLCKEIKELGFELLERL
ncbi:MULTISPECIES: heavy-metal-associated domain-containing protein [unclassified Campylobacter]|uniref:heavy-metal-associated domain-containing protein n=1 Tax=unclassified Campylobacter TaxID=2593542 RepID=UPI00123814E5|nr:MULTISPECIES: heavy metal-associated domain-containing protein [unclassified Campylobacter]KAA6224898.1 heavy-metal-associated domain-containing protein [Campylobacter sp. LR185c]KAA6226317.1 heavy-metal-associated domain-containing protein [Campylobacter sp. LR286c]KAA6226809.1 heavy-metal-associated domain-containing protein [Campylobacter sp. LR196d]KAA6230246.1 heavy-metal-associated domain-containing protein [Campylobacter sp. LR291e]KAA6233767.1 heavy-metal-associated domain-containin